MRHTIGLVAMLALFVIAPILAVLVVRGNQEPEDPQPADEPKVAVLIARQEVEWGTKISEPEKVFTQVWFRKGEEPQGAVTSIEQVKDKYLITPLRGHEVLTESHLWQSPVGDPRGDYRLIKMRFKFETSCGGWPVCPGSRVDILYKPAHVRSDSSATKVVENVLVLGSNPAPRDFTKPFTSPKWDLWILVTPEQARKLGPIRDQGTFVFVLRNVEKEPELPESGANATQDMVEAEGKENRSIGVPAGCKAMGVRIIRDAGESEEVISLEWSRVDLLWTPNTGERTRGLFLKDVLVMPADENPSPDVINLALKDAEFLKFVLARELGSFSLLTGKGKEFKAARFGPVWDWDPESPAQIPAQIMSGQADQRLFVTTWVAKKNLAAGTKLVQPENLFTRKWVMEKELDKNAATSLDTIRDHFLTTDLRQGDLVLSGHVSERPAIPPGHKAVGVRSPHSSEKFDGMGR